MGDIVFMSRASCAHPGYALRRSTPAEVPGRDRFVEAAARTHQGRVRRANEDAFAVDPSLGLFMVADGIGGAPAGEVAAHLAVDAVSESLRDRPTIRMSAGARLEAAIHHANARVFAVSRCNPSLAGMGTTVVAAFVCGGRVVVAHAGDSRAYLFQRGALELLTEDHTVANAYRRCAPLSGETPSLPPRWDALTRAVGTRDTIDVDVCTFCPRPGDTLLLCSDGLTGVVAEPVMAGILHASPDIEAAAEQLIARANDGGGPDNVTVVLARWC